MSEWVSLLAKDFLLYHSWLRTSKSPGHWNFRALALWVLSTALHLPSVRSIMQGLKSVNTSWGSAIVWPKSPRPKGSVLQAFRPQLCVYQVQFWVQVLECTNSMTSLSFSVFIYKIGVTIGGTWHMELLWRANKVMHAKHQHKVGPPVSL